MITNPFDAVKSSELETRRIAEKQITDLIRTDAKYIDRVLAELRTGDLNSRWYLARSLIPIGSSIIPVLLESVKTEQDAVVLKYIGAVLATFGKDAVDPLISLFSSENPAVRGMAGAALERIGQPAFDALVETAKSNLAIPRACACLILQKNGIIL